MSTNDRDPAAGIAAQCAGNRYDNKQWRQANGRTYAGIHFVDPAHHSSRNEALCLPDSEEEGERRRNIAFAAPFIQRIRELLFAASVVGHTFVVHSFGPVVIFIGEDVTPAQATVGEFFEDPFVLVANRPRKIIFGGDSQELVTSAEKRRCIVFVLHRNRNLYRMRAISSRITRRMLSRNSVSCAPSIQTKAESIS